jgi:hypothetical protein
MPRQTIKDLREEIEFLEEEVSRLDKLLWRSAINATRMLYWIYESYGMKAATKAATDLGIINKDEAFLFTACRDQRPS